MARAPNLDAEIDRLYAGPLAEFVGERNELAKRLRAAGDREAATSVKTLAKPSLTAWVVNRLHQEHPEGVSELLAAGERIRAAHLSDPAGLGDAVEAHRSALAELVDLARETLESEGHPAGKGQVRRITGTLEALAAIDPESLGVRPGRLVRDLEPPGFGAFGAAFPAPPPSKGRGLRKRAVGSAPARKAATAAKAGRGEAPKAGASKAKAAKAEVERKKSAALRRRIGAAEAKRQRAAEKARESERALRAAEKGLKAAERGAERKRRRAKEAEREAARAEKDADLARAGLRKARERDERARQTLEDRETELASLREWLASS